MLSNTVVVAEPNNVNIAVVDGLTTLEIESPTGFGSAQFTLAEVDTGHLDTTNEQEKSQPIEQLTLKFHLSSLEQLRIVTSDIILAASISGGESGALFQEVSTRQNGREAASRANNEKPPFGDFQLLTSESPFWLDVQVTPITTQSADGESEEIGEETTNAAAVQTITVAVPLAFIQEAVSTDDGGTISIEWIDFYR